MAFIEDAMCLMGLGNEITPYSHRITLFGKCGCLIEGAKKILGFSATEIEISLKTSILVLKGKDLKIKKYCESEIALVGIIEEVTYK